MRKKLDTRFPAARIKKIMQADEDVGKIAMAVPLLVSKALELFLQDLCDRTYEITLQRGAKTMSSLHLKQCVQRFGVFDFLRDIVSKVPDIGSSDAGGEDKSAKKGNPWKKRVMAMKTQKRNKTEMMTGHGHSGRGHGRGRGRGRGRGTHADRDTYDKCEDSADISPQHKTEPHALNSDQLADCLDATELKETIVCGTSGPALVHNFDLNVDPDETGDTRGCPATGIAVVPASDIKLEEYPGWSLPEMGKMPFDPSRFPLSSRHLDEDDDYDNEDD